MMGARLNTATQNEEDDNHKPFGWWFPHLWWWPDISFFNFTWFFAPFS